jgi:hypothetical protein
MLKKVLVLYYSQTGQLGDIVDSFIQPIVRSGAIVEKVNVKPENDFEFPWSGKKFFDAMPESVLAIPQKLQPFELKEEKYDLIIFAYQPWFLSVSIPANSILEDERVMKVMRDTAVITLIGARNMWLSSQEKIKKRLNSIGAKLVGNIALVDKNSNLVSAVTIMHWMFNGRKDSYLGIFPKPGIADEDIQNTAAFGDTVSTFLQKGNFDELQQELVKQHAVDVKTNLMFIEERAPKLFSIWASIIIKRKNRQLWLNIFKYYLLFALFIVAPIVLTFYNLLFRPFMSKSIAKKKLYYSGLTPYL